MKKLQEVIDLIFKTLPNSIDVNEHDEYVPDNTLYGDMDYFLNSNARLEVNVSLGFKGEYLISIFYLDEDYELKHELFRNNDDGDYESYFNIEELDKYKIIALFSERFGWIEKFEETK